MDMGMLHMHEPDLLGILECGSEEVVSSLTNVYPSPESVQHLPYPNHSDSVYGDTNLGLSYDAVSSEFLKSPSACTAVRNGFDVAPFAMDFDPTRSSLATQLHQSFDELAYDDHVVSVTSPQPGPANILFDGVQSKDS